MPEGHLLHRYAEQITADLGGQRVQASSPQGRFDAAVLNGQTLEQVDAVGKHLLYRFDAAPVLHVHLGLRGLFLRHDDAAVPPRGGVRLRLAGAVAWDLIAPTRCELLDDAGIAALLGRLGPDPLAPDALDDDVVRLAVERLVASRGPLGAAVLDQNVWAGLGNAWRAELLYLLRLDPATAAADVPVDVAEDLWRRTVDLMQQGRAAGQVISDPQSPDERWVYKRETCRGCGAPVQTAEVAGRTVYFCPVEQS